MHFILEFEILANIDNYFHVVAKKKQTKTNSCTKPNTFTKTNSFTK